MYEELIKTAKICCGDIPTEDCAAVCINPCDKRGEYVRFCRQWLIKDLYTALAALQAENTKKDGKIERLKAESVEKDKVISHRIDDVSKLISSIEAWKHKYNAMLSALSRVEAERDAGRPSAEVLEAIDELVEFARDRMSIGMWLGYVNVLNEWRGAQGEG